MMNKLFLLIFILGILSGSFVSVSASTSCDLHITVVNQDPYPAVPNDYVEVVFQMSGVQNPDCKGAWFELIPSYPFSLDEKDSLRILDESTWVFNYKNDWMIPYTLRVDKNALDGAPEIEVHYAPGSWSSDSYFSEGFNVTVEDSRTSFDAVIQEISGSEISIAIANVGEYTANSVVVRVPEQEDFKATGTDGQMVGNLDSGDYSIVSFDISSEKTQTEGTLEIEIYYTDNIGERRIIINDFSINSNDISTKEEIEEGKRERGLSSSLIFWVIIVIIGIILIAKRKKIKGLFNKSKGKSSKNKAHKKIPEWFKGEK